MSGTICPACQEHHIHPVPRGAEHPEGWGCTRCGAGGRDAELGDPCPSVSPSGYLCELPTPHPADDEHHHRALVPGGGSTVDWWTS